MPVALFLNDDQLVAFEAATKGKNIEFKTLGRYTIQLTGDNWEAIREAVAEFHARKFAVKTKTVEHLEACLSAQQVIEKINHMESDLRNLPSSNDNTIGVISTDGEETANAENTEGMVRVSENGEESEGSSDSSGRDMEKSESEAYEEVKPELGEEWFDKAEKVNPTKDNTSDKRRK